MNQEYIDNVVEQVKTGYCEGNWDKVLNHFGEEAADDLDLMAKFDYDEVYKRGDVKECEVFYHIAFVQRTLITLLFDIAENEEAMTTYVYLEYWVYKLFDKCSGVDKELWLQ
jgi:hypothetical protein